MPSRDPAPELPRTGYLPYVVAAVLVLATAGVYLHSTNVRAGSYLAAPLDDTFIHFQYAKQLARGRLLRFNDGDSATTGATSLLYLFVLAPGWLAGLRGLNLLIWAWVINGVLHVVGGVALFSAVQRLVRKRSLALAAMAAFLINGHMLWGVFSQMEIALISTLLLLTLNAAIGLELTDGVVDPVAGRKALRRVLIFAGLLAVSRPEGALLAGGVTIWLLARHLGASWGQRPWRRLLWEGRSLALPVACGAGMVLLFAALTGRLGTNANLKSHLGLLSYDPTRYLETSLSWLPMTFKILRDMWPREVATLISAGMLLGLGGWAAGGKLKRPGAGALVLLWLVQLTLFYAFVFARRDHFDRYYLPYFGVTVVVAWWGLGWCSDRFARLRHVPLLTSVVLLLFLLPHLRFWSHRFGDNCRDLTQQHFKVARWVKQHTAAGSRIMVNDAGAIPYLSERYTYDVVGLASNEFYRLKKAIPFSDAPVWEALEDLPRKPQYTVAYPEWIRQLNGLRVFEPLKRFRLQRRTMVANETKFVWRMRWDLLLDSSAPPPALAAGRRVTDRLDVAHISDERAHGYRRLDRGKPRGEVRQQERGGKALIDGGRRVERGELLRLKVRRGRPAELLLRLWGRAPLDAEVAVEGAGKRRWRASAGGGFWVARLPLPTAWTSSDQVELRIKALKPYTSFHYWLLQ